MLIAIKEGLVRVVDPDGTLEPNPIIDISSRVNAYHDRGMLGIAVDAGYATNHYVYLLYTHETNAADFTGPKVSQLLRVVLNPDNTMGEQKVILGTVETTPCPDPPDNTVDCIPSDAASHSIGTVRADPDGTLWVGSGDAASGGEQESFRTYDDASMAGKIMHIDREGEGLSGHPFCPGDTNTTHVCAKVYAKGFRNPFRFTLRSGGAGPAVGDVGWNSWEELDLLAPAGDYGWPCWEANTHTPVYSDDPKCSGPGGEYTHTTQFPVFAMSHTDGAVAIIGGPTYNGSDYPAPYPGQIFFGDYGSGILRRYDPVGATATQFATGAGGWVDLESAPAGLSYARPGDLIYVSIGFSTGDGEIGRISYTTGNRPPVAAATASPTEGQPPLPVQFDASGSSDPDGDQLAYLWDFGDTTHGTGPNPIHTYTARGRYTARLTVSDGSLQASRTLIVNVGGPTVTISAPANPLSDHDADSSYTITLTVTDSDGIASTKTVDVQPQTVALTLDSTPAGAPLGYAGTSQTAPYTTQAAVGFHAPLSAASQFTAGGVIYTLSSWSDGGAGVHEVTIPAHDLHLTATYTGPPAPLPAPLPASGPLKASSPVDTVGPSITFFPSLRMARRGRFSGYARDAGGGVEVAVRAWHSGKGPCRWWSWRARRLRRGPCSAAAWIRAQLKPVSTAWTVWLGGPLPPGRYVLLVRAFDRNGNVTYGAGGRTRLSLRL